MFSQVFRALAISLIGSTVLLAQQSAKSAHQLARPQGPCDIYAAGGDPCVGAHSTTRALYAAYNGPLYQVLRQSDGKTMKIGIAPPTSADAGGYADAAAQDAFCAGTYCWISVVYDQSPKHNDLAQAPRGGFSGPAMGGFNNLPVADMAPISIMGHKVYGVFIAPGMGLRQDDPRGTAVDDQAEGQYWVINGQHFNSGCCFDYGNAEIDSRDDDNGTMETTYYGDTTPWYHGPPPGPWVMTDQENNLVGCVNDDGSKLCANLPSISWRFVTGVAKGAPHQWTSLGGNAQNGALSVMFHGKRVDATYDPMRKQGAILLGNGGDNSVGSQGTFYEGAVTAAGTFPSDETDQKVQANVVAAHYGLASLSVMPASAGATPPGLETFTPGSSQATKVTFTNVAETPANGVRLALSTPGKQWKAVLEGSAETTKTFAQPVAPGATVSATFLVSSGPAALNGDLVATASWTATGGTRLSETAAEKVRNVSPIKINEFRISDVASKNGTDAFIELYNAGAREIDLSDWTLTERPTQQVAFSAIRLPAGTKLAAGHFYLLGLSNSGLAVTAHAGDNAVHVRSTAGMSAGDSVEIDNAGKVEMRRIAKVGTAASVATTVWQPLPEGPVITIPIGATNVPVASTAGFAVGEKIALGHGATYPAVAMRMEQLEVATVTSVGKPGTQAYVAIDARAGATNIKVTSLADISVGDQIRLDIASVDHGIETVTVTRVGTKASQTNLAADAKAGATNLKLRRVEGFAAGDMITLGTPATQEVVRVSSVGTGGPTGTGIEVTPALSKAHISAEWVVSPGTGLDLAAPLQFNHAANLPFSDRGTGITFTPATAFAHASNEPVQALGTGLTLDSALSKEHAIDAVVRDAAVTTAGYQGKPAPDQWFGGPELSTNALQFGRMINVREGSMVLRDASGLVVDSLNYGGVVDPWAAEGYQANTKSERSGCRVTAPVPANTSAGRFPDGVDTDSNCNDFLVQAAATLAVASAPDATNIKVASVAGFYASQKVTIGTGTDAESAVIDQVGTSGGTTLINASSAGAKVLPVETVFGFRNGDTVTVDSGDNMETAVIASIRRFGENSITFVSPLIRAHANGAQVCGSGITLQAALSHSHVKGAEISDNVPTPGAPNKYNRRQP